MKKKCPECGTGKARRLCHRADDVEICSACCASIRDPDCGDCPHYASAALNDRTPSCHGNMGLCLAHLGRKAEALAAFDRALEIDPDYEHARSNRKVALTMEEGKPLENVGYRSVNTFEERAMPLP